MNAYDKIAAAADAHGLLTMGALHPDATGASGLSGGTLVLFGTGAKFWPLFRTAPEHRDGRADPIDRWSKRIIGGLASRLGATAHYPFGGPPYAPFIDWAQKSGRAFASPTGMLVHDTVGLMISYRGALHFDDLFAIPAAPKTTPCAECATRPCVSACPVRALTATAPYDLRACHAYLDTAAGGDCLSQGCAVRRACPVSAGAARMPAQSAHHMKAFHPE
jgi:hypothetical protein